MHVFILYEMKLHRQPLHVSAPSAGTQQWLPLMARNIRGENSLIQSLIGYAALTIKNSVPVLAASRILGCKASCRGASLSDAI